MMNFEVFTALKHYHTPVYMYVYVYATYEVLCLIILWLINDRLLPFIACFSLHFLIIYQAA